MFLCFIVSSNFLCPMIPLCHVPLFPCAMVNNLSHFLAIEWIGTLWKCVIIPVPFRYIYHVPILIITVLINFLILYLQW